MNTPSNIARQSEPRVGVVTLMVTEQAELQRYEKSIEAGLQTFFEVGSALAKIQDGKLYRDTHRTFKAYLKSRWNISESRGYQLIEASAVVENLHNCGVQPKNESQARALSKAPPEEQEEVWQEVVKEHGDNATAAKVTTAVDARKAEPTKSSSGYRWTKSQKQRKALAEAGKAVVANRKKDKALIQWAQNNRLWVRVDRSTPWGNPYVLEDDGDRDAVCDKYATYFEQKTKLNELLPTLRGKVLACWCYPERCHAQHLADLANGGAS